MNAIVKIKDHANFTLTRESGNRVYRSVIESLEKYSAIEKIIIDFQDVRDVSTSFLQTTVIKLIENNYDVELINYNKSIRFKMATLVKIARLNPEVFKKASHYPQSPVFV